MIPKPLNEIEWSDIEALKDSGREEDDTIEYKAKFSGGSDYLVFSDSQRIKAVEGIAREAVAFLNGRGGDIVIGVREAANEHPKIEELTPISNIDKTVDRLAQALAAQIEPTQSVLGLRAIRKADGDADGVIVVRCPASLRAPHRFKPTKDCYVRRGRSSVPMPMDEIQDITLTRSMRRSERLALVDEQFDKMVDGVVTRHQLPSPRFHIRTVYVPFAGSEVPLDEATLSALQGKNPDLYTSTSKTQYNFTFLGQWDRKLRGRAKEHFRSKTAGDGIEGFNYVEKSILTNLTMETEYAHCTYIVEKGDAQFGTHADWLVGYLANTIFSFQNVLKLHPDFFPGVMRVAVFQEGEMALLVGNHWPERYPLPVGLNFIPDFELSALADFESAFRQLQIDLYSLAGIEPPQIWSMNPPA